MVNMKEIVIVFTVLVSVLGANTDVGVDPEPPALPPQPTPSPTEPPTTQPTSAPTTKTTATPITKSTAPPTTSTTTKPTPAPTTKPTTPTTSIPPTSSTPKPTPVDPQQGNWSVNYVSTNRSCIVLEVAVQYEILEPKLNDTIKVNVPISSTASGSCEETDKEVLKLTWDSNSLEFDFFKSNTSKFEIVNIATTLNVTGQVYNLVHDNPEFSTPLQNSYKCAKVQTLNLTQENSNVTVAYLHISQLQYQAFHNTTGIKFDSALDCEGSVTPDVVPIVVGCVLAVLVIMVLAAYLVGRRRCQARGYLSM